MENAPDNKLDTGKEGKKDQQSGQVEDGRLNEWADRSRVALDKDIDPDSKTNPERDFEPERKPSEDQDPEKVY